MLMAVTVAPGTPACVLSNTCPTMPEDADCWAPSPAGSIAIQVLRTAMNLRMCTPPDTRQRAVRACTVVRSNTTKKSTSMRVRRRSRREANRLGRVPVQQEESKRSRRRATASRTVDVPGGLDGDLGAWIRGAPHHVQTRLRSSQNPGLGPEEHVSVAQGLLQGRQREDVATVADERQS